MKYLLIAFTFAACSTGITNPQERETEATSAETLKRGNAPVTYSPPPIFDPSLIDLADSTKYPDLKPTAPGNK